MTIAAERPSIKAVAFDWGGVLCEDPVPGLLRLLALRFQCAQDDLAPHLLASMDDFQRGFISEEDFLGNLAGALGRPDIKKPFWKEALSTVYREQTAVHDLVRVLRGQGYAIGLMTNTEAPAREFHLECNYDFFDARIFSCEEGIVKPEREIYDLMAKRLRVANHELLFVDDKQENIGGAKAAGVSGILYMNPEQLVAELECYGIL
jgi:epoxide hydrolase-like predicted phosphatase